MSERIVDNPDQHGWEEVDGKWVWAGTSASGGIEEGTAEGQVTTWDGSAWTPDDGLVIDATGNATFSGTVNANKFSGDGSQLTNLPAGAGVDATGNNFVIQNPGAPENDRKWRFNVNQQSGRLRLQNLNDDDSIKITDFIRFNQDSTIASSGAITSPDFIATSDERVKDNITTAPVGLIDSLKGREWEWKESGEKGSGVVAQELEQVLPHLVHEDDGGMKSVSYMGLCAYLIEELKDCRQRLAALEGKE
jgi:hypothetical protein